MNSVNWTIKAVKQLSKIDRSQQPAIRDAVGELAHMPDCQNVKKLTNHEAAFRLRVGNYRVLFDYDGAIRIVTIEEVRKRDERTY